METTTKIKIDDLVIWKNNQIGKVTRIFDTYFGQCIQIDNRYSDYAHNFKLYQP